MTKKLLGLLLVVAMLASCLVACGGEDKNDDGSKTPAQSTSGDASADASADSGASTEDSTSSDESGDSSDAVTFESLTDNREKLVFLSGGVDDYVNYDDKIYGVLGVDGEAIYVPVLEEGNVSKFAFNTQLKELTVAGENALEEAFGGPLGVEFNTLTDGTRLNLDAVASFSGMNINFDLKAGEDGVLVTSPFMFKKPVFLNGDYLKGLMAASTDSTEITAALSELSASIAEFADNAAFAAYLRSKAVELIPEEAVNASKVTVNGDYVNGEAETDCIVLTLSGAQMSAILGSLRQSVGEDPEFKLMTAGLIGNLYKFLSLGVFADADMDMPFTTDTELYDAVFDLTDELADELKDENELTFILKRYFLNGVDSRIDFEVIDGDISTGMSCWDIYVDNGNDYGIVIKDGDNEMLSLKGGSKGDKAEISLTVSDYSYSVEMDENGEYQEERVLETVMSSTLKRDGKNFELDADLGGEVKLDYDQKDGRFDAILYADGTNYEMDGTYTEKDDGAVINARIELGGDDVEVTYTRKSTVSETGFTHDIDVEVKMEIDEVISKAVLEFGVELDTDSEETITDPTPGEDDYVIDSEEDIENIYSNFTAIFMSMIGSEGDAELDTEL
ncbi:MAG: hypothetical protein E7597_04995 [Ruminococcaceae bacterium]|nr:hypothetical protein [Oscillospiraceae bacterium]